VHGGLIPYGGTFLVFSDYAKAAIRLSALMRARVVYVLTHDSIGVGEDGPTHQPVEQLAGLRDRIGLRAFDYGGGIWKGEKREVGEQDVAEPAEPTVRLAASS